MDYGEYFRSFTRANANRLNESYQMILGEIKTCTGKKPKLIMAPREFTDITGSVEAAIILSQLLYWQDKMNDADMWIYKSYKEWIKETGLKKCQILKARRVLEKELKIVETTIRKVRGAPTLHYRLNINALIDLIKIFYKESIKSLHPFRS